MQVCNCLTQSVGFITLYSSISLRTVIGFLYDIPAQLPVFPAYSTLTSPLTPWKCILDVRRPSYVQEHVDKTKPDAERSNLAPGNFSRPQEIYANKTSPGHI